MAGPVAAVGIDVGGTKMLGLSLDASLGVVAERRVATPATYPELLDALVAVSDALHPGPEPPVLGVGIAGLVTLEGSVRYAPNLPALREAPVARDLGERLGAPVAVDNDANAAAWGEAAAGAARDGDDVLVVTLGTGIGGGLVTGGRPYRGAHGFAAEIGHFTVDPVGPRCACGEIGHWEAVASGTALGQLARERAASGAAPGVVAAAGGDTDAVDGHHVTEAAARGERDALVLLHEYALRVATGLAGLANILDPRRIVVGGGLVAAGELLLEPIRREVSRRIEAPEHRPPIPVVAAALGEHSGAIGAAVLARDGRDPALR